MKYKILLFGIVITAISISQTLAQEAQDYQGVISFSLRDIEFTESCGYDFVRYKDEGQITVTGAPCLPLVHAHLALPVDAKVLGIQILETETIQVDGTFDIMPNSKPLRVSAAPPPVPLQKDKAIYDRDGLYPDSCAEVVSVWDLVGQDFVTLAFYPLQYNPVEQKLTLNTQIRFQVEWMKAENPIRETYNFSRKVRKYYHGMLREMAFNPETVEPLPAFTHTPESPLKPGHYEYIIITIPDFYWTLHFQKLVDWRTQMGIPAKIVDIDWIYANYLDNGNPESILQDKIRNFIIDANSTWGSIYFLFGGDAGYVPCQMKWMMGYGLELVPNDTYYSDFDDDWKCEVYVGRASVIEFADICRFTNKVLTYEKSPPENYGSKTFFMGFDLDGKNPGELTKKIIKESYLPSHTFFSREYDSEPGTHKPDVFCYLNEGYNFVNHIDHGSTYQMGLGWLNHDEWMHSGEAQSFNNGHGYFNLYSIGCYCCRFIEHCILEAFVRDDQGAISCVGNSAYGYYMWGSPCALSLGFDICWWRALHEDNAYRSGETLALSKNLYNIFPGYGADEYLFMGLTLLGDPALHLWTDEPKDLEVYYRSPIPTGHHKYNVLVKDQESYPVEDALVCVMNGREVYAFETTNEKGLASIFFKVTTPGEMTVTVTAKNCKYHEGVVRVW